MLFTLEDRTHLAAAKNWLQSGEWERSKEELEEISPCCRVRSEVLRLRVEIYEFSGNPEAALVLGEALTDWQHADAGLFVALARCCVRVGRQDYAQDWLGQALSRDSTDGFRLRLREDPVLASLWTKAGYAKV
ncbi:MAG: hypothetical protein H7A46_21540 [Verrucomicrobiales bacterium]|nr:hypothetical protein [Verrucomicrobiales bacterium]MCP5524130.1 hypothetical protein [Verrucomicrobiales bacterium]